MSNRTALPWKKVFLLLSLAVALSRSETAKASIRESFSWIAPLITSLDGRLDLYFPGKSHSLIQSGYGG